MAFLQNRIKSFVGRLLGSKDGKTLLKNFSYLSILEMTSHFFPLITTPYLARVIGVKGFGILAIGTAVIAYFQSFTNYGFVYTSVRDAARNRSNTEQFSAIVSKTFFSKMVLMLLSFSIIAVCTLTIPFFRDNSVVIWCTALLLPGHVLNTDWVFQALEDMKYITIRSILTKLLFTLLVFVIIRHKDDYLWQPILTAIGTLIPSVWGLYILRRKFNYRVIIPSLKEVFHQLVSGFNMFITVFLPTVYTNFNVLLLSAYNGKQATGIYSGGTKFTSIAFSLFQLLSRTFFPFFARRMDAHKLYVIFSLSLSVIISLLFFVFARPIVMIFLGAEFEETVNVLRIVAFTPIAMSLMNSYGINYLVLKGKEGLMRSIILFVTFVGIGFGIIGAIYFSYIGVACVSLLTQFLRASLITFFAYRIKKNQND